MSAPSKRMLPDVIGSRPRIRFAVVDLPDPDSPTIETVVRAGCRNVTWSTAVNWAATPVRPPGP